MFDFVPKFVVVYGLDFYQYTNDAYTLVLLSHPFRSYTAITDNGNFDTDPSTNKSQLKGNNLKWWHTNLWSTQGNGKNVIYSYAAFGI